jgi:hypothetical protein
MNAPPYAAKESSTAQTCRLFMAPSTIPNAGIGVFTAIDVKEGEQVGYPDLAIPVTDIDWHNGGSRQVGLSVLSMTTYNLKAAVFTCFMFALAFVGGRLSLALEECK